jgi:hypothetical protein
MPCKTGTAIVRTIGIDTGKNTLHMIGLDNKGAIILREKVSRRRIAARLVNMRGTHRKPVNPRWCGRPTTKPRAPHILR